MEAHSAPQAPIAGKKGWVKERKGRGGKRKEGNEGKARQGKEKLLSLTFKSGFALVHQYGTEAV